MRKLQVVSPYEPAGDQGQAIKKLSEGILNGEKYLTLKGVTGSGKTFTMANIIAGLNQAISGEEQLIVLLETMSGKGTEIGSRFEELKAIRDGLEHPERVGVCLDTCHINDSGYDLDDFDQILDTFDQIIGIEKIKCVHVNDIFFFGVCK